MSTYNFTPAWVATIPHYRSEFVVTSVDVERGVITMGYRPRPLGTNGLRSALARLIGVTNQ